MTNLSALSWTALICGLTAVLLVVSATDASVVTNGSFETPVMSPNSHTYGSSLPDTQWTHTGRSGIDNGNPFGGSNTAPYAGNQMAFLQGDSGNDSGVTSLGQELSGLVVGQSYTLSFQAKGINTYSLANPFNVSIDGTDMFGLITPGTGAYENFVSSAFTATDATMDLLFYDQGNVTGGKVTFIDDVHVDEVTENLVVNGGFETPIYTAPHHDYAGGIAGSGWTRTGRGGIERGNPFGTSVSNCTPYEGAQMGFIQDNSGLEGITTLAQDVTGFEVGQSYVLSFEAKAIDGFSGVNSINASIDGIDLLTNVTPGTEYENYASGPFVATSETMSLVFYTTNLKDR